VINVAARLQEHSVPGGVILSEAVYDLVRGTIGPAVRDLGFLQLKNFEKPIRAYSLDPEANDRESRQGRASVDIGASSKPPLSLRVPPLAGPLVAVSNIPIRVPTHFMGRDDSLAAIGTALARHEGRVAITALHGLRGVGKTTLAAAYAERHRSDYRATWWIRAQTDAGMRADLVALGTRLGWAPVDDKEEPALAAVMERLRQDGEDILLIFDNAIDSDELRPYLPRGGGTHVLVTSNAHAWRGIAEPVEIQLWSKEIGADYLVARTGRENERATCAALSEELGGLPLAHEQAGAYCERLGISIAEYRRRFKAEPARMLDDKRHAPAEYKDGLTVAKTFGLGIEAAAQLHPAAEPLIVHAALLAPEPIPLFLFADAREKFGQPLASALADDGLDEAVAALRTLALLYRETIADERNPAITTETIRLHRLVREVATGRRQGRAREDALQVLVEAVAAVYPEAEEVLNYPTTWPRARRLDALALALVDENIGPSEGAQARAAELLHKLVEYRLGATGAYAQAQMLGERALAIREKVLGPEHPDTGESLNDLGFAIEMQGRLVEARPYYERALAINEKTLGAVHPETATNIHNLARLLWYQGDLVRARSLQERALALFEKALGPEHFKTLHGLSNLAGILRAQGDLSGARPLYERALAIREKVLGPEHPHTADSLARLADCVEEQGDLAGARPLVERALAIHEKVFGPEHPGTARSLATLAFLLRLQGDIAGARPLAERALAISEKTLGPEHPWTASRLTNLALLFQGQGDLAQAQVLFERALSINEKVLGPEHRETAISLTFLGLLFQTQGDFGRARPLHERVMVTCEKVLGPDHPDTAYHLSGLASCVQAEGDLARARLLHEQALAICEKVLGSQHWITAYCLNGLAVLLHDQGDLVGARPLHERALAIREKLRGLASMETAQSLSNLANLLRDQGDLEGARTYYERALATLKTIGPKHPSTNRARRNFARLLLAAGSPADALVLAETALAGDENLLGINHRWTRESAAITADALAALGRAEEAAVLSQARD
jgi:tetratricopeptide (TPR) repeat protein